MKSRETEEYNGFREAVFGGGCFWCIESIFSQLKGVRKVISGYAGGIAESRSPTYEDVCSGKTGHAEVVKIEYDPRAISYADLLSVFFAMHDPTTPNRQGVDSGTQYRSIILFFEEDQKKEAENFIKKLAEDKVYENPVITEIKPLGTFYPAEEYHQKYFEKNPHQAYCQINISPKIEKLRERFSKLMKNKNYYH